VRGGCGLLFCAKGKGRDSFRKRKEGEGIKRVRVMQQKSLSRKEKLLDRIVMQPEEGEGKKPKNTGR